MRALLVIAMLVPCAALAQGTTYRPGPVWYTPAGQTSDAALDVRFSACGTSPNIRRGGPLTVTRAASENYVCADGVMRSAGANQLGITEAGAQVYGAYVETLLRTDDIVTGTAPTAPWATTNAIVAAPALSVVSTTDPYGNTSNVARANFPAINGLNQYSALYQNFTASAAPWTASTFVKAAAADCTTYLVLTDNGAAASGAVALNATASWQRIPVSRTMATAVGGIILGPNGQAANGGGQPTTQAACSVYLWRANATATATMMPPIAATSATVSQPATVVTAPNALTDGANWCASVTATSPGAWNNASSRLLWSLGTTNAANSSRLDVLANHAYFVTVDGAAATKTNDCTLSLADGSAHTFSSRVAGGSLAFLLDGASCGSASGAGTGISSAMPATLNIGATAAGASQFNGLISRVLLARRPGACQ